MSHPKAPPPSEEQLRMEAFYKMRLGLRGEWVPWSRDKHGNYIAPYAADAWAAWQAAQVGLRGQQDGKHADR